QLKAPVRGVVNRLLLTTRGGVAQPGQPLVEIVPLDEGLLVEAWIRPADIAFLHAGQQVRVKLTAYDSSRYGALEGEIERIGADAISRPDREETAFAALVRTRGALTDREGAPLAITPGMMAEIDILNGRRTVMDYLVRPVVRVKERAFRD
ncbi:HlyD family efflux transporter periplasmic adaptor subunit, partial [Cereibacter changlensis]